MQIKNFPSYFCGRAGLLLLMIFITACTDKTPAVPLSNADQLIQAGGQKARMCAGCHGPKGISRVASYPSIAGLPEAYITEQLQAFRTGQRQNPMMGSVAQNLSDEDIHALSHYFASLPASLGASEARHDNLATRENQITNEQ